MNYEKKYNNIVSTLQSLINNGKKQGHIIIRIEDIENAIPELKESEDERIRKDIVDFINRVYERQALIITDEEKDNWIAWLEKLKVFAEHGDGLYYFGNNGFTYVDNPTWDNVSWLEKQEDKPQGKTALEAITEEKVGNANKVEPKFKVGDWVFHNTAEFIYMIQTIGRDGYGVISRDGKKSVVNYSAEMNYRLWSIKDAKDGDVLYSPEHNLLWIYKNKEECHVAVNLNYANSTSFGTDIAIPSDVFPATKEQRELLFRKMRENGYYWNYDTKELKKLN